MLGNFFKLFYLLLIFKKNQKLSEEHGGSVVKCLTRDRGVVGSSLTGGTVVCP